MKIKFSEKYPILYIVSTSALATILYNYLLAPFLNMVDQLCISISIFFNKDKPFVFTINIFTVVFFLLLIAYISWSIASFVSKKRIRKGNASCDSCDRIKELESSNEELTQRLQEATPYKTIIDKLDVYAKSTDIIDSIQLFSHSDLPSINDLTGSETTIDLSIRYVDGVVKETSNTNALLNMQYHFDYKTYRLLKDVFDKRNDYYSDLSRPSIKESEDDIQESAIRASKAITELLNAINSIDEIKDTHYACYRMLEILTNVVLFKEKAVECRKLLQCKDGIEAQLKSGQRTGILGTMFTGKMYCFYNENSTTKKDRIYFSAPVLHKDEHLTLLVIAQKSKLKTTKTIDHIDCCSQIYDDIQKVLTA